MSRTRRATAEALSLLLLGLALQGCPPAHPPAPEGPLVTLKSYREAVRARDWDRAAQLLDPSEGDVARRAARLEQAYGEGSGTPAMEPVALLCSDASGPREQLLRDEGGWKVSDPALGTEPPRTASRALARFFAALRLGRSDLLWSVSPHRVRRFLRREALDAGLEAQADTWERLCSADSAAEREEGFEIQEETAEYRSGSCRVLMTRETSGAWVVQDVILGS